MNAHTPAGRTVIDWGPVLEAARRLSLNADADATTLGGVLADLLAAIPNEVLERWLARCAVNAPPAPRATLHPAYPRVRDAANIAVQVLPGPVGAVLRRELVGWLDVGWRFDASGWGPELAEDLLARPFPPRPAK